MLIGLINLIKKKKYYVIKLLASISLTLFILPNLVLFMPLEKYEVLLKSIIYLNFCNIILGIGLNYSAPKKIRSLNNEILVLSNLSKIRFLLSLLLGSIFVYFISDNQLKLFFFISTILTSQDQTWYFNYKGQYKIQLFGLILSILFLTIIISLTNLYSLYICIIPLSNFICGASLKYFKHIKLKIHLKKFSLSEIYLISSQIILGLVFSTGIISFSNLLTQKPRVNLLLIDRLYNSVNSIGNILFTSLIPEISKNLNTPKLKKIVLLLNAPSIILSLTIILTIISGIFDHIGVVINNSLIIISYALCLGFSSIGPVFTFILTNRNKEKELFFILTFLSFITILFAFTFFNVFGVLSWPIALLINGIIQSWILIRELKIIKT